MTDRPIIFSAPMVRALLDGRKTQTRRLLRHVPAPPDPFNLAHAARHPWPYLDAYCGAKKTAENPRGMGENWAWWTRDDRPGEQFRVGYVPGDRLWVRENAVIAPRGWTTLPANPMGPFAQEVGHIAGRYGEDIREAAIDYGLKTTPSIHMPRWASRLTLTVTQVRVQRLQEISEEDAEAEGVDAVSIADVPRQAAWSRKSDFAQLWNSINGKRTGAAWDDNPWVVALTFTAEKRNIDAAPAASEAA